MSKGSGGTRGGSSRAASTPPTHSAISGRSFQLATEKQLNDHIATQQRIANASEVPAGVRKSAQAEIAGAQAELQRRRASLNPRTISREQIRYDKEKNAKSVDLEMQRAEALLNAKMEEYRKAVQDSRKEIRAKEERHSKYLKNKRKKMQRE